MKNIHLLPTDKPSRLCYDKDDNLLFAPNAGWNIADGKKNIYITNDEEIKERDWVLYTNPNSKRTFVVKATDVISSYFDYERLTLEIRQVPIKWAKKIILTTDKDLIKDGVQAIDDAFLEWFVKNTTCEWVEVEKILLGKVEGTTMSVSKYKIIIPSEEPKQEIVGYRLKSSIDRMMVDGILKNAMPIWNDEDKSVYFIRGHVAGSLVAKMKELQVLDLWFTPIYESEEVKCDWVKEHHLEYYHKEGIMSKAKQETLEEAADKYTPLKIEQKAFIAGAKLQAERMYSDIELFTEELKDKIDSFEYSVNQNSYISDYIKEWFEQFKNAQQ
jgi:hypothetical protein